MQSKGLVQPEAYYRFCRHVDFFAPSDDLRGSADRRTFSTACNRPDDRAEHSSAANKSAGTLIPSDTLTAILQLFICRTYTIAPTCHCDGLNVQRNIPITFNSSSYQSGVRASRNHHRAVGIGITDSFYCVKVEARVDSTPPNLLQTRKLFHFPYRTERKNRQKSHERDTRRIHRA
jgi:hypothetical protein